ncbi:TlpA family protein disulfide reductase [Actinomadura alba]|uniref:TlpA family protein disulfide reductase n=1 Tax=Actinomadura alba TaxID=406431 RepID=A0ABR7LW76_9ACTN|nr:TlpA disulfide reductase family protein [Actinomadura alba]MBC6469026.1 TlpA family protein disulfide reductase [Actinomadura alba]
MNARPLPARALAGALAATVLLSGCAGTQASSGPAGSDSRYVAGDGAAQVIRPADRRAGPRAEGTTLDDQPFRLADLQGKVVVLNFWASWCAPCRAEAPALEKIYADQKAAGVEFVGVDIKDGKTPAKAFIRSFKVGYPSVFDPDGRFTLAFRDVPPNAVPSTLVLDRKGRVAVRIVGPTTYSRLTPLVTQVAAEK